eukprot:7776510-Karenia_brevis.AAC.1
MAPAVAKVMEKKRILLFKEVLGDCKYFDAELIQDMVGGFPVIGDMTCSGNFVPRSRPAITSKR